MANTLYAAFADATMAEKAAGALLDHGVRAEDLSLVSHESRYNLPTTTYEDTGMSSDASGFADDDNDMVDAGDSFAAGTKSMGNRAAELGNRAMGGAADAVGADNAAAGYRAAAERRDDVADEHAARSSSEMADAVDMPKSGKDRSKKTPKTDNADDTEMAAKHGISTTTGADAGSGAITGTAVGLGVGAIAALASLLIPGIGLVIGGGALATALGGVAATAGAGAAAGAVVGYLKDQGMEETVAKEYGDVVSGGGSVLSVHVPSGDVDEVRAKQLLEKYGAMNVNAYAAATKPYVA